MRLFLTLTIFILLHSFHQVYSQYGINLADAYYNEGVDLLESGKYHEADSVFSLSIEECSTVDAFFNRALARKHLENNYGFCTDMFLATAYSDTVAMTIFFNMCTDNDTTYLDSTYNITDKNAASCIRITAKRKFDSNTDIITYKADGSFSWSYLVDSIKQQEDSLSKMVIEFMPDFIGGEQALVKFLSENIRYPMKARRNGFQGTVHTSFIIEKDGTIKDIKVLKGVSPELDNESIIVIQSMPRWYPGVQDYRFVKVQFNLPIKYTLAVGRD